MREVASSYLLLIPQEYLLWSCQNIANPTADVFYDQAAKHCHPVPQELQVGVLVNLGRAQWVSSVNSRSSGSTNIGLGGKLMLILRRCYIGRGQQARSYADWDLVHKSARVGCVCGMPGGALRGEEMRNGVGGAQCSSSSWSVGVHMRLACCCCRRRQMRMHWATMLECVGSLSNRCWQGSNIRLLSAWSWVAASLLWGQYSCLLILQSKVAYTKKAFREIVYSTNNSESILLNLSKNSKQRAQNTSRLNTEIS